MKPTGAVVNFGWSEKYFFEDIKHAQELITLLASGHRCDSAWIEGESYLVENNPAQPSLELAYKTLITKEKEKALRKAAEAAKEAEQLHTHC